MRTTNVNIVFVRLTISKLTLPKTVDLSLFRAPRYLLNKSHVDEYKKEIGISEPAEDFDDRNALYSL